jgi:hypothetical protein
MADLHRMTDRFRSARRCAAVALMLGLPATGHAVDFDAELAYTSDDNVTRAAREVDILKDSFWAASAGVSFIQWLNRNHRLVARGFLRGEVYDKYDGLSNASAGAQVTYQYRASGQFTAPTYGAFLKTAIVEYDSELRDSNLYTLGASWRKPVTDRVTAFAQLAANVRESDSTVFDTREISLLANVDYSIGSRGTVYLTYNYLDGDIVSTVESPWLYIVNAAEAINIDDAFPGRTAYRLNATTHVVTLGTNLSIGEGHSLDLSARLADSKADGGVNYERWLYTLAYLVRF